MFQLVHLTLQLPLGHSDSDKNILVKKKIFDFIYKEKIFVLVSVKLFEATVCFVDH